MFYQIISQYHVVPRTTSPVLHIQLHCYYYMVDCPARCVTSTLGKCSNMTENRSEKDDPLHSEFVNEMNLLRFM